MHSLIYFSQQFYGAGTTTSPFLEVKKEEKSWGFKVTSLSFCLKFPCYGNCNLLGAMNNRVWGKIVFLVCVCRVRFKDLRNVCLMLKKWNLKGFDRIFMIDSPMSCYFVTIWRWVCCRNKQYYWKRHREAVLIWLPWMERSSGTVPHLFSDFHGKLQASL